MFFFHIAMQNLTRISIWRECIHILEIILICGLRCVFNKLDLALFRIKALKKWDVQEKTNCVIL